MSAGELIFANVLDVRQRAASGDMVDGLVYLLFLPARPFPFVVIRDWKAPTGYVAEEVHLIAPSGKVAHRIGPEARRMLGSMDLTRIETVVEDVVLEELGGYLASFIIDGEVLGQTEFQVVLQSAPAALPKDVEDGFKKADIMWVGVEHEGKDVTIPAWFVYKQGKVYVLSSIEPSLEEQTVPGLPGSPDVVIITRRKYRDTALHRMHATVRLLEGPEWDQVAGLLADRRRDRHGPPQEAVRRWKGTCAIAELTPMV